MSQKFAKLTREDLKIAPESPYNEIVQKPPPVEPSSQIANRPTFARSFTGWKRYHNCWRILQPCYLQYNLYCNTTKNFKVIRLGTSIRVSKQSFDDWFEAV